MVLYKTKKIKQFFGVEFDVIYEGKNGHSALLAIANFLLLSSQVTLNLELGVNTISEDDLCKLVHGHLVKKYRRERRRLPTELLTRVQKLAQPIQCDHDFTSLDDSITSTSELDVFRTLDIDLYQGFVVDPEDEDIAHLLGVSTYAEISDDLYAHENGEACSDDFSYFSDDDWNLIRNFFKKNKSNLTAYGLDCLKSTVKEGSYCILMWNSVFRLVLKLNGNLYILQNDSCYYPKDLVWKIFTRVQDDGRFYTGNFELYKDLHPDDHMPKTFMAREIKFASRKTYVIYDTNGSTALSVLCGCLLLTGKCNLEVFKVFTRKEHILSSELEQFLFLTLIEGKTHMRPAEVQGYRSTAEVLNRPVQLNMKFTSIDGFEQNEIIDMFKMCEVRLFHGFIVNPEDAALASAIGENYFDDIIDLPTDTSEGLLINNFLKDNPTLLTPYGIQCISNSLNEMDVCAVYWNNHFHMVLKIKGSLYVFEASHSQIKEDPRKCWKCLDTANNQRKYAISKSIGNTKSINQVTHKCIHLRCSSEFIAESNLKRHATIHVKNARGNKEFSKHREHVRKFWEGLSAEQAAIIFSVEGKVKDTLLREALELDILKTDKSRPLAIRLQVALKNSKEGHKLSPEDLFGILDECSEGTFLCSNINDQPIEYDQEKILSSGFRDFLSCCSYFIEENLVKEWLNNWTSQIVRIQQDLIANERIEAESELKKKKKSNKNRTSVTSAPLQDIPSLLAEDIKDGTEVAEAMDKMCALFATFLRDFKVNGVHYFKPQVKLMRKHYKSLDFHVNFSQIESFDVDVAFHIVDHYESVKNKLKDIVAQYLDDNGYGEFKKDDVELYIHDLPSADRNMSFEEYIRKNKLSRTLKIPKKYMKIFHGKRKINILTYKGRKAARGFLKALMKIHQSGLCIEGTWQLWNMRIVDGEFVFWRVLYCPRTVERMACNFTRYIEILTPYCHSESVLEFPAFFDEFSSDCMNIPSNSDVDLEQFHKRMGGHFAFMPPHSCSELLTDLFEACDSLRMKGQPAYEPLNCRPSCDKPPSYRNWTKEVFAIVLFKDIFYYRPRFGAPFARYSNTFWHLLRYTRHFAKHLLALTKILGTQEIRDTILKDLMLAHRLDFFIAELIRFMFKLNNMDGPFARSWEKFLKSDDSVESEKLWDDDEVELLWDDVTDSQDEDEGTEAEEEGTEAEEEGTVQ